MAPSGTVKITRQKAKQNSFNNKKWLPAQNIFILTMYRQFSQTGHIGSGCSHIFASTGALSSTISFSLCPAILETSPIPISVSV